MEKKKAGYEYLLAYKVTVPIYDLTVQFCDQWIGKRSRTYEQMVQAARSGMQNVLEGNQQEGMRGYIKLCGIARGSLEELLKDFHAFLRQKNLRIFSIGTTREMRERGEMRELDEIWKILKNSKTLPDHPNFPHLPENTEIAANLMITLINQANFLIDKLVISVKEKHTREGGLSEELYRKRKEYRGF